MRVVLESCNRCLWWRTHPNMDDLGECRYSPPRAFNVRVDEDAGRIVKDARWPITGHDDICSRWQTKGDD